MFNLGIWNLGGRCILVKRMLVIFVMVKWECISLVCMYYCKFCGFCLSFKGLNLKLFVNLCINIFVCLR